VGHGRGVEKACSDGLRGETGSVAARGDISVLTDGRAVRARLDSEERVLKRAVEEENVRLVHVAPLGFLAQGTHLAAGKRLGGGAGQERVRRQAGV
jgi:hypothetical protein